MENIQSVITINGTGTIEKGKQDVEKHFKIKLIEPGGIDVNKYMNLPNQLKDLEKASDFFKHIYTSESLKNITTNASYDELISYDIAWLDIEIKGEVQKIKNK